MWYKGSLQEKESKKIISNVPKNFSLRIFFIGVHWPKLLFDKFSALEFFFAEFLGPELFFYRILGSIKFFCLMNFQEFLIRNFLFSNIYLTNFRLWNFFLPSFWHQNFFLSNFGLWKIFLTHEFLRIFDPEFFVSNFLL